ncbi:MAG: AMP-binding protein, partial [Methanomassiliicoccales archaeon]
MDEYARMYRESVSDPVRFWSRWAKEKLDWFSSWHTTFEWEVEEAQISWFKGGRINACHNCVDRHASGGRANKAAIIWQGDDPDQVRTYTYRQLHREVCRFANVLKSQGVEKGDRVSIYLPMIPELPIAMLACARIGAVHSVVFGGFSPDSLRDRIEDSQCKLLITADGGIRGGKEIPLKENVDQALEPDGPVERVIVVRRTGGEVNMVENRDQWYYELMADVPAGCDAIPVDAEDPLFILYTSGSTGKPKGVLHTTAGYLLYAQATFENVFDHREEDVYWCTADIGWITGHSYIVYGPLAAGATTVMFEGSPTHPRPDRLWEVVEKFGVNIFYTAPTAIRA